MWRWVGIPGIAEVTSVSPGPESGGEARESRGLIEAARQLGWQPTPAHLDLLTDLEAELGARPGGHVAVLVDDHPEPLVEVLAQVYPDAVIASADAGAEAWDLHPRLAAFGPFDVIIDHGHQTGLQLRNFRNALLHVRPGGVYVVSHVRGDVRPEGKSGAADRVWPFVAALVEHQGRGDDDTSPRPGWVSREFVDSPGRLVVGRGHLIVVNRTAAAAKLREWQMNQVLELSDGATGSLLHQLPAVTLESSCQVNHSRPPQDERYPQSFNVPEMSLREYRGVVCGPEQVAFIDNLLLPDTYRHNTYERLTHPRLTNIQHYFVKQPTDTPVRELAGTYFFLDSEFRRHFGHVMTEQLPRLWAWREAKERYPDLKALLSINPKYDELSGFEKDIFGAAGIPADDLVPFVDPVRVERLIAATPMFSMPNYVHPDLADLWTEVGDQLATGAPDRAYAKRIFVTRPNEKARPCHNGEEVEELFSAHDFEIVRPELLPLAEQVTMFREADVIAGYAGSGFLSMCYGTGPKRIITIAPESYVANMEYLVSAVRGFQLDRVVSVPDIPQPPGGFSTAAYTSGFTFDFDNEGRFLRQVLRSLDGEDDPEEPAADQPDPPTPPSPQSPQPPPSLPAAGGWNWQRAQRLLRGGPLRRRG